MQLVPINGCVLLRLTESTYEDIAVPDKKYDTKTSGIVVAVADDVHSPVELFSKKVFFESFKDDTAFEEDGQKFAFIKFEDLKGYRA